MIHPSPSSRSPFHSGPARALALVAGLGFFALFPAFFFYHFAISYGIIPSFLGGGFGPWTVVVVALGVPLFLLLQHQLGRSARAILALVYAFLFYVTFWIGLNNLLPQSSLIIEPATQQLSIALLSWTALFLIGAFAPQENLLFRRYLLAMWISITVLTLASFDRSYIILDIRNGVDENIASYKELARSACYASLFLVIGLRKRTHRFLLATVAAFTLLAIGARSELLGFVVAMMVVEGLHAPGSVGVYAISGAVIGTILSILADNPSFIEYSRFGTLLNLGSDESWVRRDALNSFAWYQIRTEPLSGIYGGHILAGDPSSYAHNALSAWVSLGLTGFILYLAPTVYCTWVSGRMSSRNPESTAWSLALAVNLISLLFIATSQGLFWTLPALGWGLALRARLLEAGWSHASAVRTTPPKRTTSSPAPGRDFRLR